MTCFVRPTAVKLCRQQQLLLHCWRSRGLLRSAAGERSYRQARSKAGSRRHQLSLQVAGEVSQRQPVFIGMPGTSSA